MAIEFTATGAKLTLMDENSAVVTVSVSGYTDHVAARDALLAFLTEYNSHHAVTMQQFRVSSDGQGEDDEWVWPVV